MGNLLSEVLRAIEVLQQVNLAKVLNTLVAIQNSQIKVPYSPILSMGVHYLLLTFFQFLIILYF